MVERFNDCLRALQASRRLVEQEAAIDQKFSRSAKPP
jgi:hypothetical protein